MARAGLPLPWVLMNWYIEGPPVYHSVALPTQSLVEMGTQTDLGEEEVPRARTPSMADRDDDQDFHETADVSARHPVPTKEEWPTTSSRRRAHSSYRTILSMVEGGHINYQVERIYEKVKTKTHGEDVLGDL